MNGEAMDVVELDSSFKEWLYEKHPEAFDQYHLAVYKSGEKPEVPAGAIDLNSQTIQTLIIAFHKAFFLSPHPKHYTMLYNVCRQFARRVNDESKVLQLKKLYKTTGGLGFPLSLTEKIVFRETAMSGWTVSKSYNYKRQSGITRLGNLIEALDIVEEKIVDLFYDICAEKDVEIPLAFPDLSKVDWAGGN